MSRERAIWRYRGWYARFLRLYPRPYHARFGEGMQQTFRDVLRERARDGQGLLGTALWMFAETLIGVARENMAAFIKHNRNIVLIALATGSLLLIPLIAMQFNDDVVWSLGDFIFAGTILFGTGLAYELLTRRAGDLLYRAAIGLALASALFLVWANLAVGLIGSEDQAANTMYGAVLAVGIIGAVIARFRPQGMALVLFAMALAQASIAVIALIAGMQDYAESSVAEIINVNGFFVVLFVVSGLLFQQAAEKRQQ